jgi:uncharacterized membrane protein
MRYEERLDSIETQLAELRSRLDRVEGHSKPEQVPATEAPPPAQPPPAIWPPPQPPREPSRPARPGVDFEDLLGGRVLAWVGGSAVVLGVVFFLAMAVRNGWIDEPTRVVLAFLGSTALLVTGLYLYERRGQTEAAIAAVAASIAALYASLVAATQLYDLVAPVLGLGIAGVIGAAATAIAVRWSSPLVGSLGIVGALVSPVLVEAGTSGVTLAFMAIALVSAVGVLLWQRWDWLATAAFVVSVPQLLVWLDDTYRDDIALALPVLLLFWALYVVAAIGYELRVPTADLRASSAMLLLANALLTAGVGWYMLDDTGEGSAATAWVVALAVAHVGLGAAAFRSRISGEVATLLVAVGIGLSAVGLALALDGPALVAGWAVEAAVLAWVARRTGDRRAHVGVAVFLTLAAGHILTFEAPLQALLDGVDELGRALVALAVFAAAALLASRQDDGERGDWRLVLEAAGAAALVYAGSVAIVDLATTGEPVEPGQTPQVLLSGFWSVVGVVALVFGLLRDDRRFRVGGLALLGLAVFKVFLYDLAALESIYRVLSFIALGLLLLAAAYAYQRIRLAVRETE